MSGQQKSNLDIVIQAIVALIAFWGAGLSTWEAYQRRKPHPPDVRVEANISVPSDAPDNTPRLILLALNQSGKTVYLSFAGLFSAPFPWKFLVWDGPKKSWHVQRWTHEGIVPRPVYPYSLHDGKSVRDLMELAEVAEHLEGKNNRGVVVFRVCVVDEVGNVYRSNPVHFRPDEWVQRATAHPVG